MKAAHGGTTLRLVTALAVIPVLLLLVWAPALHYALVAAIAALAAVGLREYYAMARGKQIEVESGAGVWCGALVVLSAAFQDADLVNLVLFLSFAGLSWLHILHKRHSLAGIAATLFGLVYVGWIPAHFLLLHGGTLMGAGLVTLLLVANVFSDTGAYFVGRALGKHKLAPSVSPNKTWEGAIGGVLAALGGMALVHTLHHYVDWSALPGWSLPRYLVTGGVLAFAGQVGDLVESMLKRDSGVKDSGTLFPGHGGVLDRCDSILFTTPLLYYMVAFDRWPW
ncbi:MAG: phosphatidate cytidylyltransferase [Candidatus Hydrogenedentes bacterium]|nr:phosphatidate cytidylyltransferase [Candidatus Hydrogenedentota bacterium]